MPTVVGDPRFGDEIAELVKDRNRAAFLLASHTNCRDQSRCSSVLNEANLVSVLSECLSAEHDVVLSDEAEVAAGDSAGTGVLAVLAGVRLKLVRHVFENE